MKQINKQKGVTLLELTVVLLILIALAGLAMPYLGGTTRAALCKATDVTMANIKRAIMDRYYLDTLGTFPASKGNADYSLNYLFSPGGWDNFDPATQIGWRGPYLQSGVALGGAGDYKASNLDGSFKDASPFDPDTDHVHLNLANGQTVVLDGWGRPIMLQVHDNYGGRLVSAGPGSGIGIDNAGLETVISGNRNNDDRVLYLNAPTPASDVNPGCD